MRLKQRRKVDLPQPDGPISAVTLCSWTGMVTFFSAWNVAVVEGQVAALGLERRRWRSEATGALAPVRALPSIVAWVVGWVRASIGVTI